MFDERANIDLVFRNGLEDYEASPPDVWSNIQPVIGRKRRRLLFVRYAAAVAALISVGIGAYTLGYRASKEAPVIIAMNNEPNVPLDIAMSSAIVPAPIVEERAAFTVVPQKVTLQQAEAVIVPSIAMTTDVSEASYAENFNIDIPEAYIAEIESNLEIQEALDIASEEVELFAQELQYQPITYDNNYESEVNNDKERWSILAMASPTYYSQFTASGNDVARQIKNSDQGKVSYSGGVGFAYKVNNRFSVQSGFYYSSMGKELEGVTAYSGFAQVNPSKGSNNFRVLTPHGAIQANNPDVYLSSSNAPERVITRYTTDVLDPAKNNLNHLSNSIYQDLSYLELPVLLRYKVIDRKMGVSVVGGVSYNLLVNNSAYTIVDGSKYSVGATDGLANLSLSSSLGMGMEYKFSKSVSFNLEPTFRYFLNSSHSDKIEGMHAYSLGIFSGFAYKF